MASSLRPETGAGLRLEGVLQHLRFFLSLSLAWLTILLDLRGGWWLLSGLVVTYSVMLVGDLIFRDEEYAAYEYRTQTLFDVLLYLSVPTLLCLIVVFAAMLVPGDLVLPVKHWLAAAGIDLHPAAAQTTPLVAVLGALATGLVISVCGSTVGHELVHRTGNPLAVRLGRILYAFSLDPAFSTDHVHGHHLNVATPGDATSARRGESSYAFIARSIVQSNATAWRLEAQRARKNGRSPYAPSNPYLQNVVLCLALVGLVWAIGGWFAVAMYVLAGLWGQTKVAYVNYVQHYGLVRVPGSRIELRHSWNSNRWISTSILFNLYLHSGHHRRPDKKFYELRPDEAVPLLPHGTLVMVFLAMAPHLWRRTMAKPLADWDERFATPAERSLLSGG
jgi:hypothetical protein